MKTIIKSLATALVAMPLLTSCIEETFPTSGVTQGQLEASVEATSALVWGMPGNMISLSSGYSSMHCNFGYPALMHALDVMTDDMVVDYGNGYDWFATWSTVGTGLGEDYAICQTVWETFYNQILACNKAIAAINPESENETLRFYYGAALAYRAYTYLEAAQCYESLPTALNNCISPKGKDIAGLTIPIVTEKTTEDEVRNNPRATHEDMFKFIENDLLTAVSYLDGVTSPSKTLPDLAVAYGVLARLYLWDAQYAKASDFANKAITTSKAKPLTAEEWLNTSTGFNDDSASAWLFSLKYEAENDAVKTSIINWTSFVSNEQDFGYSIAGARVHIGAYFYNRMDNLDFRKLAYVAPESSILSGKERYLDAQFAIDNEFDEYTSLKIRPGNGEMVDYKTACAVAIPLMRVEEMYFIDAEAKAHLNPTDGNEALKSFMRTYRYGTYDNEASTEEDVVEEIIFQKRMELWGEGRNFFDVKRLNMSVTRAYSDSNFSKTLNAYNTEGRPQWMNFCIVKQELSNNIAVQDYNNINPVGLYSVIKDF